jgi:hypothetical protein
VNDSRKTQDDPGRRRDQQRSAISHAHKTFRLTRRHTGSRHVTKPWLPCRLASRVNCGNKASRLASARFSAAGPGASPSPAPGLQGTGELAFDSQRKEDNYTIHARAPGPVTSPHHSHLVKLRHTEPGVLKPGMLQVLALARSTRPALGHSMLRHGHGQVHTCGMEVCELTAVALTAAPLPPPRSLRRAQASTSPRLA